MTAPATDHRTEISSLTAEVARLREQVQLRTRHADVLERCLREMHDTFGLSGVTVAIDDPIMPVGDGVSLQARGDLSAYLQAPGPAPTTESVTERPWWPTAATVKRSLTPSAGWFNHALQGRVAIAIGVSVCGLPRAQLAGVVAMMARTQSEKQDFAPVFLYDGNDFDLIREYGFVFERLPGPEERASYRGTMPWVDYCRRRRALVERKWNLLQVIVLGPEEFGRAEEHDEAPVESRPAAAVVLAPVDAAPADDEAIDAHGNICRLDGRRRAAAGGEA